MDGMANEKFNWWMKTYSNGSTLIIYIGKNFDDNNDDDDDGDDDDDDDDDDYYDD